MVLLLLLLLLWWYGCCGIIIIAIDVVILLTEFLQEGATVHIFNFVLTKRTPWEVSHTYTINTTEIFSIYVNF